MTTANTTGIARTPEATAPLEFPDPPECEPDDMTSFNRLTATGNVHHLIRYLGNPETTLVAGEHYLSPVPTGDLTGVRYPDLLIAFGVNPAAYYRCPRPGILGSRRIGFRLLSEKSGASFPLW